MKMTTVVLLGVVLGANAANAAVPQATRRAIKCAEAKFRAVRRKVDAKLTCEAIAVRRRAAINPLCIANAEAAFLRAFARAEARGGCFNPNGQSSPSAENAVNEFIGDIGNLLIPCTPTVSGTPCGPPHCNGRLTLCLADISGAPVCTDTNDCGANCGSDATCEPGRACVPVLGVSRCCDICQ